MLAPLSSINKNILATPRSNYMLPQIDLKHVVTVFPPNIYSQLAKKVNKFKPNFLQ